MSKEEFGKLVEDAIKSLPKHIREKMDNVASIFEDKPSPLQLEKVGTRSGGILLGLYQGVPQTVWGRKLATRLPDKITIFQDSIEYFTSSKKDIVDLVKKTVWHEIAHHFGFSEKQIRDLEAKWRKNGKI